MNYDLNMEGTQRIILIKTNSEEEKVRLGTKIHDQLVGNEDYIESNIILNIDQPNTIMLWIMDECEIIPEIKL